MVRSTARMCMACTGQCQRNSLYACDLGVWVYLVPSALTLVDSPEHRSALVIGKHCRHYAPLPLVPLPTLRLPDRTATRPHRRLPRMAKS
jgi:hypothetical protein